MFPSFFFFLLSAFFCLSFSSLPLLFEILKPKICPPDEVFGKDIYHHHPDSKKRKSSDGKSGSIPMVDMEMLEKLANHIYNSHSLGCQGHF